ncbi:hypothetical protein HJG60_009882 [Phyllostomus discolor]|uniref:BICD family-like cargo adapter 1 n=1 Tax=Phyllostomus discolor TaxID=89673 RepID=A0A834B715_9CHIR|nr:hypothetical protein HJG60_009882 [Phyllostomus discolor]
MKPLPSEKHLLMGVGGQWVAHLQDSVLLERRGKPGISGREAIQTTTLSQGRSCGHTCPPPGPSIRSVGPRPQAVLPATCRKQAVEAELDTCKAKLRAVEAQLLEILEEKLRLRQEVEAWEEDMQQMVRERVDSQLQRESRDTERVPTEPGAARARVPFPLGRWRRWW